jgi:hypothetical protein
MRPFGAWIARRGSEDAVGEVLGLAVVVVALAFGVAAAAYLVGAERRRVQVERTPLHALDPGDREAALTKAAQYFRIAQQSARILESLLGDDMVRAVVPPEKQDQMRDLVDRFYEL